VKEEKMIKVMLFDDDEMVRYALRSALEIAGIEVVEQPNGKFIRNLASLDGIDVVVTDIFMPEVEGMELISMIKTRLPHIPVIAVSGGGRINAKDYLQSASDLGADAAFAKPFNEVDLVDKIRELAASSH
jgi:CheY-like chemotaxis protein